MIVLYTIYSNIHQYALIDKQLNEKTQVTDKNTQKPRRHQKNPDLVEKNPAVATLNLFDKLT